MVISHLHHGRSWPCNITLVTAPPDVKPNSDHRAPALVFVIALAGMALHLATGWRYGLFRDEFYYLACANHLDWGYVDHPPPVDRDALDRARAPGRLASRGAPRACA